MARFLIEEVITVLVCIMFICVTLTNDGIFVSNSVNIKHIKTVPQCSTIFLIHEKH